MQASKELPVAKFQLVKGIRLNIQLNPFSPGPEMVDPALLYYAFFTIDIGSQGSLFSETA